MVPCRLDRFENVLFAGISGHFYEFLCKFWCLLFCPMLFKFAICYWLQAIQENKWTILLKIPKAICKVTNISQVLFMEDLGHFNKKIKNDLFASFLNSDIWNLYHNICQMFWENARHLFQKWIKSVTTLNVYWALLPSQNKLWKIGWPYPYQQKVSSFIIKELNHQ